MTSEESDGVACDLLEAMHALPGFIEREAGQPLLPTLHVRRPERGRKRDYEDYKDLMETFEGLLHDIKTPSRHRKLLDQETGQASYETIFALLFPDLPRAEQPTGDELDELVCIDATAGKKIFSIAAAVATLNGRATFTYVPTFDDRRLSSPKTIRVRQFDGKLYLLDPSRFGGG